jgi:hypothetical protein
MVADTLAWMDTVQTDRRGLGGLLSVIFRYRGGEVVTMQRDPTSSGSHSGSSILLENWVMDSCTLCRGTSLCLVMNSLVLII